MQIKPVKTAVIGCGMISDIYLTNLKNRFYITDLAGCADMVDAKARAQAEKYGIRQMTVGEILADPDIELVLNLTYPSSHYEISKAILEAGKHCYSEKMMCRNLDQAGELDRIRKEKNVMFAVAPDTFLGASQQTSRYLIDRGLIGRPVSAIANLCRGYHMIKSTEDDRWRKYSVMHEGGGIPYDMGGYYLHQLFNIAGPVKSLSGYSETLAQERPYLNPRHEKFDETFRVNTPNTVNASMKFRNGMNATLNISSEFHYTSQSFTVYGTEGILHMGDPNDFGGKVYIQRDGERMEFPLSHPFAQNSRGVGAADMAYALRTGRPPRLRFEMGYHALEIITAIAESDETGRRVEFETMFDRPEPISSEFYGGACEERSLYL